MERTRTCTEDASTMPRLRPFARGPLTGGMWGAFYRETPETETPMIDKTYQPSEVEGRIYAVGKRRALPRRPAGAARRRKPYCIVIPPPNVTGSLHIGHALNNTLQDVLSASSACAASDVLWQPGTDHAGIATQMVVERQLMERQEPDRRDDRPRGVRREGLGVEGRVRRHHHQPAASASAPPATGAASASPWTRGCRAPCARCSSTLYKRGADLPGQAAGQLGPEAPDRDLRPRGRAGRGRRAISGTSPIRWRTAADELIVVATTRPETMLGDTAVAVHPDDERYQAPDRQAARSCRWSAARSRSSPTTMPIPEKGTGAVKITPAHDFNDFEVGKPPRPAADQHPRRRGRLNLEGNEASSRRAVSAALDDASPLHGLDRFVARKRSSSAWRRWACSRRSRPHATWCRTATARAS